MHHYGNSQGNIKPEDRERWWQRERKPWNNKNNPIEVEVGGTGTLRAGHYQGQHQNKTTRKGLVAAWAANFGTTKSIWSEVRLVEQNSVRAEHYQGNIKHKTTRKRWSAWVENLEQQTILLKRGLGPRNLAALGIIRVHQTKRPEKGGGKVSGKLWNNKNQPIEVHVEKSTQMAEQILRKTTNIKTTPGDGQTGQISQQQH